MRAKGGPLRLIPPRLRLEQASRVGASGCHMKRRHDAGGDDEAMWARDENAREQEGNPLAGEVTLHKVFGLT